LEFAALTQLDHPVVRPITAACGQTVDWTLDRAQLEL